MPPKKESVPVVADDGDDEYSTKDSNTSDKKQGAQGKRSNPNQNVGGTAKDGGLSTEDTVRDGGEDEAEHDPDYKPS